MGGVKWSVRLPSVIPCDDWFSLAGDTMDLISTLGMILHARHTLDAVPAVCAVVETTPTPSLLTIQCWEVGQGCHWSRPRIGSWIFVLDHDYTDWPGPDTRLDGDVGSLEHTGPYLRQLFFALVLLTETVLSSNTMVGSVSNSICNHSGCQHLGLPSPSPVRAYHPQTS